MLKEDLIMLIKIEKDYSESQVRKSIETIRGMLSQIERDLQKGEPIAENGLQGNEWRLYKELSNLEMRSKFLKKLEQIE